MHVTSDVTSEFIIIRIHSDLLMHITSDVTSEFPFLQSLCL